MARLIKKERSGRAQGFSLLAMALIALLILLFNSTFVKLDNWLSDCWFSLRQQYRQSSEDQASDGLFPATAKNDDIVVVVIDDEAILSIPGLFKGDRYVFAQALENLNRHNPKAIGLDVFFPAESDDPAADRRLINAVSENCVLKAYRRDGQRITPPYPRLAIKGTPAPTYFSTRGDETIRSVSMAFTATNGKVYPSFQAQLFRLYYGLPVDALSFTAKQMKAKINNKEVSFALYDQEFLLINYDRPLRSFKTVSFTGLYNNTLPAETFRKKVAIIGFANSMTEEKFYTPLAAKEYSSFLSALVLSNLLNRNALKPAPAYQGRLLALLVLAVFLLVLHSYFSPKLFFVVSLLAVAASLFASLIGLTLYNQQLSLAATIFAIAASFIVTTSRKYYLELSEKLRIKSAFQHYVTASVVNEILKNPEKLNLHGEERNLTIFFSDIEGFTSISEGMSPLDVVSLLNEYLSEMTDIIFKYDGLLDKYEGDAIMAVYGAPVNQSDHAIRACKCALENQKALACLRKKWASEGKPEIKARIGINTGTVVVGNMGSKMRFDYTVIGDNVNLAARLETANKIMNTEILVSENTATLAESHIISRYLGKLKVAGKERLVKVYELLADRNDPNKALLQSSTAAKEAYESAYEEFQQRNFKAAKDILAGYLEKYPDDKPAKILLGKVKGFLIVPPPPTWEDIITQEK
jgi:adenylate cyclase